MASSPNSTEQHKKILLEALTASLGIVTTACKNAGVGRTTYYDWLRDDEAFKAAVDDIVEISLDFGETQLHKLMQGYKEHDTKVFINGDTKEPIIVPLVKHVGPDAAAVIFFLKTKGKGRGYTPSKAIDITSGGDKLAAQYYIMPDGTRIEF